jgi:hypothetical protein
MIILSFLALGLVVSILLVGLAFYLILSDQKRGQAQCDEAALNFAKALNGQDHIGQMNTIVEHSRELVYLSRQASSAAYASGTPAYTALSDKLVAVAREGAQIVEQERCNLIDITVRDCRKKIAASHKAGMESGIWILPWFIENRLRIQQVQFGWIDNLSSVGSSSVIDDLHQFDLAKRYVDKTSNLYYANINAKLPEPDDGLSFCFSALPARVENTDSPERLASSETFTPTALVFDYQSPNFTKPKQLPEAVQVVGTMHITTDIKKGRLNLQSSSIAVAPGALGNP